MLIKPLELLCSTKNEEMFYFSFCTPYFYRRFFSNKTHEENNNKKVFLPHR